MSNAAVLAHRTAQALQVVAQSGRSGALATLAVGGAGEVIAAFDLSRRNRPRELALGVDRGMEPVLGAKQAIHSGLIGDYVTWLSVASPCSLSSSRSADAPIQKIGIPPATVIRAPEM
jgi:hypothetical protein